MSVGLLTIVQVISQRGTSILNSSRETRYVPNV